MDDPIRKMKYCYKQSKHKPEFKTNLKTKGKSSFQGKGQKSVRGNAKYAKFATFAKDGY